MPSEQSTDEREQPESDRLLFDAIDEHYDEEKCGAHVGDVVESMLTEPYLDVAEVGSTLQELYFEGSIYQPSKQTVARVSTDSGSDLDDEETERCAACGNTSEESSLGYSEARDELVCSECVAFLGQNGYYPDEDGPDRSVTVTYELGGDL